ncbi:MAG: hypothetical protein NTW28_22800, partial [Candidatus Solibacter sp.]|nr:hypothetical protein [Candidatus Solibacter sp.]
VRAVPVPDPEEPGASGRSRPSSATMFVLGDFRSPPSLLKNLRNPEPLATYLWDRFSDTARQTLSDPDTSEEALSQTLL